MALGQQAEPQQTQGQTKEPETTAPAKGKKKHLEQAEPGKPQAKPETGTDVRGQTNVKGRPQEIKKNASGTRSSTNEMNVRSTNQTNVNQSTKVNVQEFKSRHSEVFSLGRHPQEFFVQRFGTNHVRLIGNEYFAFVDGCWVAVDVDGYVYSERVICPGDAEFIEVD
jgi:hypothetical protein